MVMHIHSLGVLHISAAPKQAAAFAQHGVRGTVTVHFCVTLPNQVIMKGRVLQSTCALVE